MKKLLLVLAVSLSTTIFAQSTLKEDVDIIQGVYGKNKKELVSSYMNLTGAKADAFWKMYDEYEAERKVLGRKKIALVNDYATNYATLTDAQADALAKGAIKNNMDYEKLFEKYYEKSKVIIGSVNALKFIQLEGYLQTEVKRQIQDAIPFVGEMDRSIKK